MGTPLERARGRRARQRERWARWVRRSATRVVPALALPSELDACFDAAARAAAIRLALALAREELVEARPGAGAIELRLPGGQAVTVPLRRPGAFGLHAPEPTAATSPWLDHPAALLEVLAQALGLPAADHARVLAELEDSAFNLALARLTPPLRDALAADPQRARDPRLRDPEHFVIEGHPWHPMHKTRLGLGLAEHLRHAPELLAHGDVRAVELPRGDVQLGPEWIERAEPLLGRPRPGTVRLPVHVTQLRRLPRVLPPELWARLRVVEGRELRGRSLLSLRTVALDAHGVHLKLAVGVHTTSARRVVSPMSVHNGPQVTTLLEHIMARDPDARGYRLMPEHATAGLTREAAGPSARELGAILRPLGAEATDPARAGWVCAALGERWPGSPRRLLELATAGYPGASRTERLAAGLEDYVERLVPTALRFLAAHGVALEVHLQNMRVCVDEGRMSGFVLRDLGGIRLHRPALARSGHAPDLDPASFIVTDDHDEVVDKLFHALVHAHLTAVFGWAEDLGLPAAPRWAHTAAVVRRTTDAIAADPSLPDAQREDARRTGARLLAPTCRAKALLRMRLGERSSDYDYVVVDNALFSPP